MTFLMQLWNTAHRAEPGWEDPDAYPIIAVVDNRVMTRTPA
jgi:hypothetical protein